MKALIILLFPIVSFSQNIYEVSRITSGTNKPALGIGIPLQLDQDTIPVIMLVCDTSFIDNYGSSIKHHIDEKTIDTIAYIMNRVKEVWWQFGYEIRCSKKVGESGDHVFYSAHVPCEYLDRHKKPLPKSTIVWLTKPINQ